MTTSVKVDAHCSTTEEVKITINSDNEAEEYTLQDGESGEYSVYDDKVISVKEVEK